MATKTKPVASPVDSSNGAVHGFLPTAWPEYRWVEQPGKPRPAGLAPTEGGEPFRAEIRCNLTFGEVDRLWGLRLYKDVWERLAPYVRTWNALGRDATTGEIVLVPPPAAGGPEVFMAINAAQTDWLLDKVRTAHLGGEDQGKGGNGLATLDEPPSDSSTD